jgi:hypothetical protein
MNTDQPVGHQPLSSGDPMMSYEVFDAEATAFVSYTTVSHHQSTTNYFPSPPRSPIVTSTTSFGGQQQQPPQQPPPCYDEYYGGLSGIGSSIEHQQQQPTAAASNDFFTSITKTEADSVFMHSSVMTNYGSTPDPTESFVSSDTCPETPDSSVKEEADVNSPDTGSYVCLWMECHEEFVTQKALVEHISDNHMESKKGCEEFPCLWKVSNSWFFCFFSRRFNNLFTYSRPRAPAVSLLCDVMKTFWRINKQQRHLWPRNATYLKFVDFINRKVNIRL